MRITVEERERRHDKVLQFIKRNPDCTIQEISKYLGIRRPPATTYVKALKDAGLVTSSRERNKIYYRSVAKPLEFNDVMRMM